MGAKGCLYQEDIISGIGLFSLQIDSGDETLIIEPKSNLTTIHSAGYDILIKRVIAPTDWLPLGMRVDAAKAWLLYITKRSTTNEQLTISFKLLHKTSAVQSSANTGQWLTAVEFENAIRQVHIGAQDEEWFALYGEQAWMPGRLVTELNKNGLLITEITTDGLITKVPKLFANERFYLHYILAESSRRKSIEYPDDWDVSTWYVVDQSKKTLEDAWYKQLNS